jgi:CubicO group peptidase (beta-lactamase class C family)
VLGGVLAAINGTDLEAALDKFVCQPLNMPDTHFYVTDLKRLTVPYADGLPPRRMGEPEKVLEPSGGVSEFSPGRILNADIPQSGSGGMAGTADDVMKLLDSFNGGNSILTPETIKAAITNQIGEAPRPESDAGKRFGFIGSIVDDPIAARTPCPVGTVEWGGIWGHNWILDPINRLTILTLTNTAFEGCWGAFREEIRDAVYGC